MTSEIVFEAIANVPGHLPESDEPLYFRSALHAWDWHEKDRISAEDHVDDNGQPEEYSETCKLLTALATEANWDDGRFLPTEPRINPDGTGVVYGPRVDGGEHDLGMAYCVVIAQHDGRAHPAGYTVEGCQLCEAVCFCGQEEAGEPTEGRSECVYCYSQHSNI